MKDIYYSFLKKKGENNMLPILPNNNKIDDFHIHKYHDIKRAEDLISVFDCISEKASGPMIRTASSGKGIDKTALLNLFIQMLSALNLKTEEDKAQNIINNIATTSNNINADANNANNTVVQAANKGKERKEEIKITSKSIRDSHYQVDISKDIVNKNGKQVYMVSCYARDAYLGRYLIKRNYFYTIDKEASADEAYDEIVKKINAIKNKYYAGEIDISSVSSQMVKILDGVVAEIKFEEDSISNKG
jgi:hypothetical protein